MAVPPSLPLGIERTALVRSGSSGSATGTFGGEWQCDSHCHSVVSALGGVPYTATRRRACRIGTIRGEWQCVRYARGEWRHVSHCHSVSSVPHRYNQGRVAVRPVRSGPSGSACWPGRTPDPQPSRRLESGPTGQMRSGNRPPSRREVAPRPAGLGLGPGRTERRSLGRGPR